MGTFAAGAPSSEARHIPPPRETCLDRLLVGTRPGMQNGKRQVEERQHGREETSDKKQLLLDALRICDQLNQQGRLTELEPHVHVALELATVFNDPLHLAKAFKFESLLHYSRLSLDRALESGFKAVKLLQGYDEDVLRSSVLNNIGVYYTALGIPERGLEYFEQAIGLDPENGKAVSNAGQRLLDMWRAT